MKYLKAVTIYITDMFSVKMIFETLFLPWKRDQGGTKGLALNEKLMVWLLNLTSRLVGFIVKSIVFFVYLLFICGFFAVSVILIVSWFLMPIIIFGLFIAGVFQILSSIHG